MRRQLVAAVVLFLSLPAVAPAQTKIPPAWLGTWQSGGMAPKSSPLGAPLPELPYAELDMKIGEFVEQKTGYCYNAVELETGELEGFHRDTYVNLIDAELTVTE